jgi:hypothetical protein
MPNNESLGSLLGAIIRSAGSGATLGYANNIAAAGDATIPLDAGSSTAPDWLARYQQNLAQQYQADQAAKSQHGNAWTAGNIGGQMMNPIYRLLPAVATPLAAAAQIPPMLTQQQIEEPPRPIQQGLFGSGFQWLGRGQ